MVNMFNGYFSSVFTCGDNSIPTPHTDVPPSTIDTLVITPQLVFNKLANLKCGKSPGPDGWPTELIKNTAELISIPLFLYIINLSLAVSYLMIEKSIHNTFT